ncbi:protein daughter of sevenless [Biomphalaria glabrata]|nr:protein daughter of sevenless-like [Biomphalaria glabrata]
MDTSSEPPKGWLTKSPPEKKLGNHIKLFRAKWKRRFFVMTVKDGRHELAYYKDQSCQNKKGTVNLKDCKSTSRVLQTNGFPNLLAVKTISKNKPRTYYLAADNSYEVDNWLYWLRLVSGIKDEALSNNDDSKTKEHQECNQPEIICRISSDPQPDSVLCSDVSVQYSLGDADSEENPSSEDSPKAERNSSPQFADFIQYLNERLTVTQNLGDLPSPLSGSSTSLETKTVMNPPEITLDLLI